MRSIARGLWGGGMAQLAVDDLLCFTRSMATQTLLPCSEGVAEFETDDMVSINCSRGVGIVWKVNNKDKAQFRQVGVNMKKIIARGLRGWQGLELMAW